MIISYALVGNQYVLLIRYAANTVTHMLITDICVS